MGSDAQPIPEGISSLLDTDLYKMTMQCAVLKYFPDVGRFIGGVGKEKKRKETDMVLLEVTYGFTNRTPNMKLSRRAYNWLVEQIHRERP